jgi:hypothetical protein
LLVRTWGTARSLPLVYRTDSSEERATVRVFTGNCLQRFRKILTAHKGASFLGSGERSGGA